MSGWTRPWSSPRRAAVLASAFICLAAVDVRSDVEPPGDGLRPAWVTNWLAPVDGTARLMHALESMSDGSFDAASLLVLGLSLVGGGRMVRRLKQQATRRPGSAEDKKPSRSPVAFTHLGPRRIAR